MNMGKLSKILITLIITVIFLLLLAEIGNSGAETGSLLGYLSIALVVGYIGAIVAIWKNKKQESN